MLVPGRFMSPGNLVRNAMNLSSNGDMPPSQSAPGFRGAAVTFAAMLVIAGVLGCGLKSAPKPPSLHLPKAIANLAAARVGGQVGLRWTTPKETTDGIRIRKPVELRICRGFPGEPCQTIAAIHADPGGSGAYPDILPAALAEGPLREIRYQVFAVNRQGRSAGPSNAALTLAGKAPPPVGGLAAATVPRGVLLRWKPAGQGERETSVRIERRLLTPVALLPKSSASVLPPAPEPIEETLEVSGQSLQSDRVRGNSPRALDQTAQFGRTYRYRAVRIVTVPFGKARLQAESAPGASVTVLTQDTFPPASPTGLVAVPVLPGTSHGGPEIDLSWRPNSEPDLAGYIVDRRDVSVSGESSLKKQIAPEGAASPITVPAFRDFEVRPGHTYVYFVIAVDRAGNKSSPSVAVTVVVPSS